MFITVVTSVTVSTILYANRRVLGYAFSNEKEVVDYVAAMAPILCLAVLLDTLGGVLSGPTFVYEYIYMCVCIYNINHEFMRYLFGFIWLRVLLD